MRFRDLQHPQNSALQSLISLLTRLPATSGARGPLAAPGVRRWTALLAMSTLAAATLTAMTMPAEAQTQAVQVQLATGEIVTVQVPPGKTIADMNVQGTVVAQAAAPAVPPPAPAAPPPTPAPTANVAPPAAPAPAQAPASAPAPAQAQPPAEEQAAAPKPEPAATTPAEEEEKAPVATGGAPQERTGSGQAVPRRAEKIKKLKGHVKKQGGGKHSYKDKLRNADGSPTRSNPGFVDALPGPSSATGVPNFIIRKFRVPPFLLPIYQAAGIEYGVRWEVLAAINEIETDYGRNLNVSSAGALGWMQFMPATWKMYGTDANRDGRKDPYNPVDAIFAAARYLAAADYDKDVRRAVFAYNHADWYVDSVLLRARLIAGVPADLVGSLTGLTEGRFPVYARARYADDLREQQLLKKVGQGENAAHLIEGSDHRRSIGIYTRLGAPVVAVNDGVIKETGQNEKLGRYIRLQDVYGNRFTYAHLDRCPASTPCPEATRTAATPAPPPRTATPRIPSPLRRLRPAASPRTIAQRPRTRWATSGPPPPCPSRSACSRTPATRARASPAVSSR